MNAAKNDSAADAAHLRPIDHPTSAAASECNSTADCCCGGDCSGGCADETDRNEEIRPEDILVATSIPAVLVYPTV